MQLPRWVHRIYAFFLGRFWLPCPLCGRHFGGHEISNVSLMVDWSEGEGVCRNCAGEAQRRNEELMVKSPPPPWSVSKQAHQAPAVWRGV